MESTFENWIKENITPGYCWTAQEMRDVFGCWENDCVRIFVLKKFVERNLKMNGRSNADDVAAICSLTSNETMKKTYVQIMAPILDAQNNHPSSGKVYKN